MSTDLEARLRAVEDELAIRNLAARFSDACNERDLAAFRKLWTQDAVWEIGPPLPVRVEGVDAIVGLLVKLLEPKQLFMQMTHSGVIEYFGSDKAIARFVERERGQGNGEYYENLAVYRDELVRESDGWKFSKRVYEYRYLDTSSFQGRVVPRGSTLPDGASKPGEA